MDVMTGMEALARKELLERIFDRLSDEERRLLIQMVYQQKSKEEILQALERQSAAIGDVRRHQQGFLSDLTSNIAGNALWAGAAWLLRRLAAAIR